MSTFELLLKGINKPIKVPRYIWENTQPSRIHDKVVDLRYPAQESKLDELRKGNSWALIVLDACRFDRFMNISQEYMDVEVEPISAAATNTFKYQKKCWPDEYDVDYITGAAPVTSQEFDFSDKNLKADGIAHKGDTLRDMYGGYIPNDHISNIIEVWREAWDESLGVCPPEPVTDRSIEMAPDSEKLVIHYFQPHEPYIGKTKLLGDIAKVEEHVKGGAIGRGIYERVQSGEVSDDYLLKAYDDNLRRVLKEVVLLFSHISTHFDRVIIMADHGEALGEYGKYKHSKRHPYVRKVPWGEIKGVNEKMLPDRKLKQNIVAEKDDSSVKDRLLDLGYME